MYTALKTMTVLTLAGLLSACGPGGGVKTPTIKKNASASDIQNVCAAVTEQNLANTYVMLDKAKEISQEKGIFKGNRKKSHALLQKAAKEIQKTSERKCCSEIRKTAGKFNSKQRTISYNNLVNSYFNLTPNERKKAIGYIDSARGDITFDKAALVSKAQINMLSCLGRVEKDVEAKYSKQARELSKPG